MKLAARLSLIAVSIAIAHDYAIAKDPPKRPRILGIASVTVLSSNIPATLDFYTQLGLYLARTCDWCEERPSPTVALTPYQTIRLRNIPPQKPSSLLEEVTFRTEDLDRFAKYLSAQKVKFNAEKYEGNVWRISLNDPEGHGIAFVGLVKPLTSIAGIPESQDPSSLTVKMIHAGLIVKDRAAMEHFYKDILGFRPYWHGGRKDDGVDDWVSFQVPDGTDWVEFMLNVPANADKHLLGVMNHIAIGVTDIQATKAQLIKNGLTLTEEPKIGRGGKWQLNVYDPDGTRIEFMEFTPVQKPCCSDYTGPHPKP